MHWASAAALGSVHREKRVRKSPVCRSVCLSVIWSSPRRPPVTRHPSLAHRQSTALSRVPSATKHSRRVYSKPAGASERPRWAIPRLACVNPAGPGGHRPRRVARPAL